jgi:predicted DNA-binding ribbon-helix-helix protein
MQSSVVKRSIAIAGHKTSISLEDSCWIGLKDIARDSHLSLSNLVCKVDARRANAGLSSALRVFVLQHFQQGRRNGAGQGESNYPSDLNGRRS